MKFAIIKNINTYVSVYLLLIIDHGTTEFLLFSPITDITFIYLLCLLNIYCDNTNMPRSLI